MEAVFRVRAVGGDEIDAMLSRVQSATRASRRRVVRETVEANSEVVGSYRRSAVEIERTEQLLTRSKLRELAKEGDARKAYAALVAEMEAKATAVIEAEVGKRGTLSERERRQVESLALAMVASHQRAERERTRETERAEQQRQRARQRFLAGSGSAVANAAVRGIEAFASFNDDVRERRKERSAIDLQAMQVAAGDIGDPRAAAEISTATQHVAELTGIQPEKVVEAIGQAQANFSNLADAASRGSYLRNVLPMLGQAAVATNTSLTDMVQAAGEFQRQIGVTNEQLPAAIAQAIQGGRLGSISFKDQARHMGAIGGAAVRFLSNRPEDAMQSLATTNALFQFAGRAGGGGDVSATRAQAFLSNFTSARGQRALHDTLGHDVFDSSGQIQTREGESQSAAFRRVIEEAYSRTGGNATRFLDTVAGSNVRGRALGDQLFRDLRAHGGRLEEFGSLVSQQQQATTQSTISAPFQAVAGTEANARARRDVREFYGLTGRGTEYATHTEDAIAQLRRDHPFVMGQVGENAVFRGSLDVANRWYQGGDVSAQASRGDVAPNDRAGLQRATARDAAVSSVMRDYGPTERSLMGSDTLSIVIARRTAEELARLQLRDQAAAAGQGTVNIDPASIQRLADALQNRPLMGVNDAVHYETRRPSGARYEE